LSWIGRRLRALRAWFLVRLGLWRGRWRRGRVTLAGIGWRYGLYVPAGLRDADPAPLIVVLHGCKQRALGFAYAAGWTRFADRARVRLLCPDQRKVANLWRCWNWFHPLAQRGKGELDVVIAMIDDAGRRVNVDSEHVIAVGLSAGGALAVLLAIHHGARFRAVAVVAALPFLGELNVQDPRDVMRRGLALGPVLPLGLRRHAPPPLAIIHGALDDVVDPKCADDLEAQARELLRRSGADVEPATPVVSAETTVTDYRAGDALVLRRISVARQGHWWSGGPGGHPFCEAHGAAFTALCGRFFAEAGALRAV
jgi:poly(3-hydroxybutyrate) depolymerase